MAVPIVYTNFVPPAIDAGNLNTINNVIYTVLGDGTNAPANGADVRNNTGTTTAINSGDAATLASATALPGRLLGVQRFTANGTYTPTAGTTRVIIEAVGGGGAGGGAATTGAGQYSAGAGGGSGAYSVGLFTSGFSGLAVTIGTGGTGVSAGTGNNGGTTSVGGIITAPGGLGGPTVASSAGPSLSGGGAPGAVGVISGGTTIKLSLGISGGYVALSTAATTTAFGSPGAPSPLTGAGAGITANIDGSTPVAGAFGAGGGGGSNNASLGVARTGGAGANGVVIIYEYS